MSHEEASTKQVLVDKLLSGVTIKHVRTLARRFGNVRTSYVFGYGKNRTFLLTFDKQSCAGEFIRSNPSVNGKTISVSLYTNNKIRTNDFFIEFEYDEMSNNCINIDGLALIFEYFDYVELISISMTCKLWYNVAMYMIQKQTHLSINPTFSFFRLHHQLTDDNFISIIKRTNLTSLDLSCTSMRITDRVCKAITEYCPNLAKFSASRVPFKKRLALTFFAEIPNILYIDMSASDSLTERVLQTILSNCKSLEHLNVSENQAITGKCFYKHLPNSLKSLNIASSSCGMMEVVTEKNDLLWNISRLCPSLESLNISELSAQVFPCQDEFTLDDPPMNVEPHQTIKELASLKSLHMREMIDCSWPTMNFSTRFDYILARTPCLEFLDLTYNHLSCEIMKFIAKYCTKLTSLNVSQCTFSSLSRDTFTALEPLQLTELRVNDVLENYLGDIYYGTRLHQCIESIFALKYLKVLGLSKAFMDEHHLVTLITQLTDLEKLNIENCVNITNDFLTLLTAHPDFGQRTKELLIIVKGTCMEWDEDLIIPDIIKLDFGFHWNNEHLDIDYFDDDTVVEFVGDEEDYFVEPYYSSSDNDSNDDDDGNYVIQIG